MEKRYITLRDGKRIYAEIYRGGHQLNLLMLHGGPGEGCGDFRYQAIKLSEHFNVFIFDQRGVLRSDKIGEDESFGLEFLVDDCENLKQILGVSSWSILGHSFGGEIALLYSLKYPSSVDKVIFECPTFYYPMSIRSIYIKCINIAQQAGMIQFAKEIKEFIDNTTDIEVLTEHMREVVIATMKFDRKIEVLQEIEETNSIIDATYDQWQNGKIHFDRLQKEGKINENMIPLIEKIECPSLLILGKYDSVCFDEQREFYLKNSINGNIVMFDNSDHRPHNEEPTKFTEIVVDFVNN
ncbi:alpha/beta fold hydrolase [Inconstantimicrobium mannanitabidum]|uniref:Proline iminopeptidase n=1 Tax=Inconstantimicrobium mannanitabidum TaxID=1604901 RepID=A0ACB5REV1_9CLOT|nr:alpha/beta hydrolase [Clostridium sp. TW13]GKX67309.1 proline iminopeptidase [Clostridium sp. TW13]